MRYVPVALALSLLVLACSDDPDPETQADATVEDASADSDGTSEDSGTEDAAVEQTCLGTPEDSPFPADTDDENRTIHWELADGCIAVTYDPDLAEDSEAIAAAFDVWNAIDCSQLCFQRPLQLGSTPENTADMQGVHITTEGNLVNRPDGLDSGSSLTWTMRNADATIRTVVILVQPPGRTRGLDQVLVGAMARGVGLDLDSEGEVINTRPLSLETDVEDAVCALYGDPSHCPD